MLTKNVCTDEDVCLPKKTDRGKLSFSQLQVNT